MVSFAAQSLVVVLEVRVAQNADGGPMMEGIVEGLGASPPHQDLSPLATLLGDRNDTAEASKGVEVTEANGIVSVAEKGGERPNSDSLSEVRAGQVKVLDSDFAKAFAGDAAETASSDLSFKVEDQVGGTAQYG